MTLLYRTHDGIIHNGHPIDSGWALTCCNTPDVVAAVNDEAPVTCLQCLSGEEPATIWFRDCEFHNAGGGIMTFDWEK